MSQPTAKQTQDLFAHMLTGYGAHLVNKSRSAEMKIIAVLLDGIGIVDKQAFLTRFATTLGHLVYVPFVVGVDSPPWTCWNQIVTITHECTHVVQHDRLGALKFGLNYIRSSAKRAILEAEAYRSNLELHHWRYGTMLDAASLAHTLSSYGCDAADIAVATAYLRSSAAAVARGAIINPTTKRAIDWLNANAPGIRQSR